jgi:pyridoxamine 5'-phosphate oxidase
MKLLRIMNDKRLLIARGLSTPATPPPLISVPGRIQYTRGVLELEQLDPQDPIKTFTAWFEHARTSGLVSTPEAVVLSTAALPSGRISSRTVLMKQADSRGFVIYSNWGTSKKSRDITSNPRAALNFWWEKLERQIRVEGSTERLTEEESQIYASTRPRDSQIGAWASPQSQTIQSRNELVSRVKEINEKFEDEESIPVPHFWGGLRIVPDVVEFWQGMTLFDKANLGRPNRLHDRFVYEKQESGEWAIKRLAP